MDTDIKTDVRVESRVTKDGMWNITPDTRATVKDIFVAAWVTWDDGVRSVERLEKLRLLEPDEESLEKPKANMERLGLDWDIDQHLEI